MKIVFKVIVLSVLSGILTNCSKEKDASENRNPSLCESIKYNSYFLFGQDAVDAFEAKNCEVIYGGIFISDSEDSRVTDLSSLSHLKTVGSLTIENTKSLKSLEGLERVTHIKELLHPDGTTVGGYLTISNNDQLSDISALSNLVRVEENLTISDNNQLSDLSSLNGLEKLEGKLSLHGNASLITLNSFNALDEMYEGVVISDNSSLVEISRFTSLFSINGHLEIHDNPMLTGISGFNNLKSMIFNQRGVSMTPEVRILNNANLTDFCGLQALADNAVHNSFVDVDFEVAGNKYNPSVGYISSEDDCRN